MLRESIGVQLLQLGVKLLIGFGILAHFFTIIAPAAMFFTPLRKIA
jgi:hypothetical protein